MQFEHLLTGLKQVNIYCCLDVSFCTFQIIRCLVRVAQFQEGSFKYEPNQMN